MTDTLLANYSTGQPERNRWRLEVDDQDFSGDFDRCDINTPAQVHTIPRNDTPWAHHVLGARGFTILIHAPSERLLALVDGGRQVHHIKPSVSGQAIPVPVHFHQAWTDPDGVQRMFGSLAVDPTTGPLWVTEPVGADASGRE
ncbi:hypothetical protein [Streptomyces sp. MB09-02B]|uniref:hypothetical protein n=1 Tax=Streptomyces sp. MB09-02B TaxID=3028667 RepID=UPI0029AF7E9C|nr:hypothetical protein [Streptomyces sp. MB09-02B]MDX3643225.1 hypothetical protein [Streptomyces sp. MB09-02B]